MDLIERYLQALKFALPAQQRDDIIKELRDSILSQIEEKEAEVGVEIDEGALYPMLRRLETQGLLTSEWREETKRNKRFYRLSADGKMILKQLAAEWKSINASLNGIL